MTNYRNMAQIRNIDKYKTLTVEQIGELIAIARVKFLEAAFPYSGEEPFEAALRELELLGALLASTAREYIDSKDVPDLS